MNRVDEIKFKISENKKKLVNKITNWDFGDKTKTYNDYLQHIKPEQQEITNLDRELRIIIPYKLTELYDYGEVMDLKEFKNRIKHGLLINDDGFGKYVKDGMVSDIEIYVDDVKKKSIRKEFNKIVWYNI